MGATSTSCAGEAASLSDSDLWEQIAAAKLTTDRAEANGLGDWAPALDGWTDIRQRFPNSPAGYVGYAEALLKAARYEDAEAWLAKAVALFPHEPWAAIHFARAAILRRDWTAALERWRHVMAAFPEFEDMSFAGISHVALHVQEECSELTFGTASAHRAHARGLDILRRLEPWALVDVPKARVGSAFDGGYVMADDFEDIVAAFSLGVGNDANWDAAVAARGIRVYQFDHTVDASPMTDGDIVFAKKRVVAAPCGGGG
jgi:tetratricopeptide (TPR) repeat protein